VPGSLTSWAPLWAPDCHSPKTAPVALLAPPA